MPIILNLSDTIWNQCTAPRSPNLTKIAQQDAQLYARIFLILGGLAFVTLFAAIAIGSVEGALLTLPSVITIGILFILSRSRFYFLTPHIAISIAIALNLTDIAFVSKGTSVWLLGSTIYLASFFYRVRPLIIWALIAIVGGMLVLFLRGFPIVNASIILTTAFIGVIIVNKALIQRRMVMLTESEARLRAAIDGSLDGFFLLTQQEQPQTFQITDANVMAARMVNRELPKLVGAYVSNELAHAIFPHDEMIVDCQLAIQQQQSIHQERALAAGRWIEYQIVPFDQNIALTIRDITQAKETAVQSFQLAVEKERVSVLANFITGASHEFRTPLSIIETTSYLLSKVTEPTRRQNYQKRIGWQIDRIVRLVERLALVSKLETLQKLDKEQVPFQSILADLQTTFADSLSEKNISLQIGHSAQMVHVLCINTKYFLLAMREIASNCIRHCPSHGLIQISAAVHDQQAIISIKDTAEPIDAETLPHIFNLFFRKDEAHSTPGFGLGLPIARRVIELHGGKIALHPQSDIGNLVEISLPNHS